MEGVPSLGVQYGKSRGHKIAGRRGHAKYEVVRVIPNLLQIVQDYSEDFWRNTFDWGGAPRSPCKGGQAPHDEQQKSERCESKGGWGRG